MKYADLIDAIEEVKFAMKLIESGESDKAKSYLLGVLETLEAWRCG